MVAMMAERTTSAPTSKLHHDALRHVDRALIEYPLAKREIDELSGDIIHGGYGQAFDEEVAIRRSPGSHADPTAIRGSLLYDHLRLRELGRINRAIDDTLDMLGVHARQFVSVYYWQHRTPDSAANELGISRTTLYRWREAVRVGVASRLGWM